MEVSKTYKLSSVQMATKLSLVNIITAHQQHEPSAPAELLILNISKPVDISQAKGMAALAVVCFNCHNTTCAHAQGNPDPMGQLHESEAQSRIKAPLYKVWHKGFATKVNPVLIDCACLQQDASRGM